MTESEKSNEEREKPLGAGGMEDLIKAAEAAVEASEPETALRESAVKPPELIGEIEKLKTELDEERERVLRVAAEFENFKKRTARDLEREKNSRAESLIRRLIQVLDNLERALAQKVTEAAALRSGVELTLQAFRAILASEGVEKIEAHGAVFDPNLHEALAVVPEAGVEAGTILEVFEAGYTLNGLVLKPSRVKVAGKPSAPKEAAPQGAAE